MSIIPTLVNPEDVAKTIAALEAEEPWRRLLGDRYVARPLGDKMTIYLELSYIRGRVGYPMEASGREACRICLKMARIKTTTGKLNSSLTKRLKIKEQLFRSDPVNIEDARNQALSMIERYKIHVDHLKSDDKKRKLAKARAKKNLNKMEADMDSKIAHVLNLAWRDQRSQIAKTLLIFKQIEHLKDLYRRLFKLHPKCTACGILFGEYHCSYSENTPLGGVCGSCYHVYEKQGLAKFKKFVERGKRYNYGAY